MKLTEKTNRRSAMEHHQLQHSLRARNRLVVDALQMALDITADFDENSEDECVIESSGSFYDDSITLESFDQCLTKRLRALAATSRNRSSKTSVSNPIETRKQP